MSGYNLESGGVHHGSHLRMDAERNYNMEVARNELLTAIGIKGDPVTLYPLLDESEMAVEIDRATKPPCWRAAALEEARKCPEKDQTLLKTAQVGCGGKNMALVQSTQTDEELARHILLKNPQCQHTYNVILELVKRHRLAREEYEALEDCSRYAIADKWALEWEALEQLSSESIQRVGLMKRDNLAREYRRKRLAQRRKELEEQLEEREKEDVFHSEELLREIDNAKDEIQWQDQIPSFFYNNPLYVEEECKETLPLEEGM